MNYLELTNKALYEAGVDLDPLTSVNFASPVPTKMYNRFKGWVKDAWEDIQLENNELEFTKGVATIRLYPALSYQAAYRSTSIGFFNDPQFESADNDLVLTYQGLTITKAGNGGIGEEGVMYFDEITDASELNLLDRFNEVYYDADSDGTFEVKGWGRYDLKQFVSDLEVANYQTFEVQDTDDGSSHKLFFVPWARWKDSYEYSNPSRGMPQYFTETPDGKVDFYPRPDKDYAFTFSYTKQLEELVEYTDTPAMDSRYHGAIVWLAVMYYANFDRMNDLWVKASKRHHKFMYAIDRDLGPEVNFGGSQYDE